TVSRGIDSIYYDWRRAVKMQSALFGLMCISGIIGLYFYQRRQEIFYLREEESINALRDSEFRYRRIVDTANEGIWVVGEDTITSFVNERMADMLGYRTEEIIGKPVTTFMFEEDVSDYHSRMGNRRRGLSEHYERRYRHKNGQAVWTIASAVPIFDDDQHFKGSFAMFTDITEHKKIEDHLRQAQKMEAVGHLAGGIAHDFNNMLTAIIGYGSLLNTKLGKDSELRPFVDQILSSAGKSANLTRQLLAFSRKQEIAPQETDLNQLIKGMEKLLLRLIGEDIELKTQLAEKALTVMVDPGQIEQVLMNLSTNARDTMPDGGLLSICTDTVKLDTQYVKGHAIEKPGMYALVTVTDTGRGMDERTQQKIFEPFFTTKEIGKGTGLGLSIVYGIVKQHGGNITVYSEPGRGTTFRIYLPLIESTTGEAKVTEVITPKGGTETILFAEDNEDVRVLSKKILEENGYKIIDAVNGEDAINKFKENKDSIQLIVVDVIMPRKSGKEAIDEIKRIKPDVKVLFTSGYTSDIINRKGILEEGINFISKPVTPHNLLAKIREILDKEALL
ncbi:MAG: PAS domain S-box protein, partial [Dissulfurispiraceae bacterium]